MCMWPVLSASCEVGSGSAHMMVGPVSTLASTLLPPDPVLPPVPLLPPEPPLVLLLLHPAATVAPPIKVNVSFRKSLRFIECESMRVASGLSSAISGGSSTAGRGGARDHKRD